MKFRISHGVMVEALQGRYEYWLEESDVLRGAVLAGERLLRKGGEDFSAEELDVTREGLDHALRQVDRYAVLRDCLVREDFLDAQPAVFNVVECSLEELDGLGVYRWLVDVEVIDESEVEVVEPEDLLDDVAVGEDR